ncbi:MAG: histidine phosphatase family protein [Sphaerochaetaceae bacterium]
MKNGKEYTMVLVRHGYSLGNKLKTLSGQSNVPLMESGRKELLKYREMYDYPKTDLNYSSDLSRAVSTFETLYEGKSELDGVFPQLREINFGNWENTHYKDGVFEQYFSNWIEDNVLSDGESFDDIRIRMVEFFKQTLMQLKARGLHSATLVSHMIAVRCLLVGLGCFDKKDFFDIKTPNGQGYKLVVEFDGDNIEVKNIVAIAELLK